MTPNVGRLYNPAVGDVQTSSNININVNVV